MQYARRCAALACITIMIANASGAAAEERPLPWKVNPPIITMEKSVFIECKKPKEAAWCGLDYIGPKLEMYLMKGLKKDTVTAIDDRQPHHSPAIQFSNFKFFEDRETHAIQIYLTAYGENTEPLSRLAFAKQRFLTR